jgi:hypothetical protein
MFNPWLAWSVKVVQMAKFAAGCAEHRGNHFRTALTGNGIAGERRYVSVMFCDLVGSISISAKLDAELPLEPWGVREEE